MLKEYFSIILENYKKVRKEKLFGDDVVKIITKRVPEVLGDKLDLEDNYKIVGSIGKGNFCEIPWIAILDTDITKTVQKGYDIVYLFDSLMNGFYLSLNQGVEQYGEGNTFNEISENTKILRSNLLEIPKDLDLTNINLNASQELGQKYEVGHICGKFYSMGDIPSDEVLINDLERMIKLYRILKEKVGIDIRKLQKEDEQERSRKIMKIFKK